MPPRTLLRWDTRQAREGGPEAPFLGISEDARRTLAKLDEVTEPLVLLEGPDGSGRHCAACALHERDRPQAPFLTVDCREVPPHHSEATLFGFLPNHGSPLAGRGVERGDRIAGAFESAGEGTLLLVEVAAVSRIDQLKLARTLRTRKVRSIGDANARPYAARVVVTTQYDLDALTRAGLFDETLFEVLAAAPRVRITPLVDRAEDIVPLFRRFQAPRPIEKRADVLGRIAACRWTMEELREFAEDPRPIDRRLVERELLEAIVADPSDEASRLVYGDLLLAAGDPRGELIQVQIAAPSTAMQDEEERLLAAHRTVWCARVLGVVGEAAFRPPVIHFRRGFLAAMHGPSDILRRLGMLFRAAPALEELELDQDDPTFASSAEGLASPLLAQLRRLRLNLAELGDHGARAMAACARVGALEELVLAAATPPDGGRPGNVLVGLEGAHAFASASGLAGVGTLVLEGLVRPADHADVRALFERYFAGRLVLRESPA